MITPIAWRKGASIEDPKQAAHVYFLKILMGVILWISSAMGRGLPGLFVVV